MTLLVSTNPADTRRVPWTVRHSVRSSRVLTIRLPLTQGAVCMDLGALCSALLEALGNSRTDSMGHGIIIYFPSIAWEEEDEFASVAMKVTVTDRESARPDHTTR